jgi:hypothetical protein
MQSSPLGIPNTPRNSLPLALLLTGALILISAVPSEAANSAGRAGGFIRGTSTERAAAKPKPAPAQPPRASSRPSDGTQGQTPRRTDQTGSHFSRTPRPTTTPTPSQTPTIAPTARPTPQPRPTVKPMQPTTASPVFSPMPLRTAVPTLRPSSTSPTLPTVVPRQPRIRRGIQQEPTNRQTVIIRETNTVLVPVVPGEQSRPVYYDEYEGQYNGGGIGYTTAPRGPGNIPTPLPQTSNVETPSRQMNEPIVENDDKQEPWYETPLEFIGALSILVGLYFGFRWLFVRTR